MMILKYPVDHHGHITLQVEGSSPRFLSFGPDLDGRLCIWVSVTEHLPGEVNPFPFKIVWTGEEFSTGFFERYYATVNHGAFVLHLFGPVREMS